MAPVDRSCENGLLISAAFGSEAAPAWGLQWLVAAAHACRRHAGVVDAPARTVARPRHHLRRGCASFVQRELSMSSCRARAPQEFVTALCQLPSFLTHASDEGLYTPARWSTVVEGQRCRRGVAVHIGCAWLEKQLPHVAMAMWLSLGSSPRWVKPRPRAGASSSRPSAILHGESSREPGAFALCTACVCPRACLILTMGMGATQVAVAVAADAATSAVAAAANAVARRRQPCAAVRPHARTFRGI